MALSLKNINLRRTSIIVIALFAIGLLIRVALINTHGTSDFNDYIKWGKNTHEIGLSKAFEGGYFPIQYLSFGASYAIAQHYSISAEKVIRIFNTIFEIGILFLLIYILKKYISIQNILIYFWLNPFALIMYQQGYVDAQFSFFVLLALAMLTAGNDNFKKYFIAGIPLGISLLMKPQPVPLFLGLGILAVIFFIHKHKKEAAKMACLFAAPFIIYLAFSLYFGFTMDINNNHKTLPRISRAIQEKSNLSKRMSDIGANSLFLTAQYAYVATKRMPAINANMPNPWFFTAVALNKNNVNIYLIKDTDRILGVQYRTIGSILFFVVAITIMFKIARSNNHLDRKTIFLLCLIPIILPYLTTSAHENHFYLGFISTIILGSLLKDKFILSSGYILGALNGIHILYLYAMPYYFHTQYDIVAKMPLVAASIIVFFVLLYHLLRKSYKNEELILAQ